LNSLPHAKHLQHSVVDIDLVSGMFGLSVLAIEEATGTEIEDPDLEAI